MPANRQFRAPCPNRLWVADFIGNMPPVEAEELYYAALTVQPTAA